MFFWSKFEIKFIWVVGRGALKNAFKLVDHKFSTNFKLEGDKNFTDCKIRGPDNNIFIRFWINLTLFKINLSFLNGKQNQRLENSVNTKSWKELKPGRRSWSASN